MVPVLMRDHLENVMIMILELTTWYVFVVAMTRMKNQYQVAVVQPMPHVVRLRLLIMIKVLAIAFPLATTRQILFPIPRRQAALLAKTLI